VIWTLRNLNKLALTKIVHVAAELCI